MQHEVEGQFRCFRCEEKGCHRTVCIYRTATFCAFWDARRTLSTGQQWWGRENKSLFIGLHRVGPARVLYQDEALVLCSGFLGKSTSQRCSPCTCTSAPAAANRRNRSAKTGRRHSAKLPFPLMVFTNKGQPQERGVRPRVSLMASRYSLPTPLYARLGRTKPASRRSFPGFRRPADNFQAVP
jgi:hypothetical protein